MPLIKRLRLFLISSIAVMFIACGSTDEIDDSYKKAKSVEPLRIPGDLSGPSGLNALTLPEIDKTAKQESLLELQKPPQILSSVDLEGLEKNSTENENNSGATSSKPTPAPGAGITQEPEPSVVGGELQSGTDEDSAETTSEEKSPEEKSSEEVVTDAQAIEKDSKPLQGEVTTTPEGTRMLVVQASFDEVWPSLGNALKELGFQIDDASRGNRIYTVVKDLPLIEFENKDPHPGDEKEEIREEFQVHLKEVDKITQLTIHNKYGKLEGSGLADHLLLQIEGILESEE